MSFGQVVEFWNWCWILKSLFTCFIFCWIKKKDKQIALQYLLLKPPNLFYILKVPQNTFHSNIKKNTTTKIFQYSTPISTFNALSKWHDPHIRLKQDILTQSSKGGIFSWYIFSNIVYPKIKLKVVLKKTLQIFLHTYIFLDFLVYFWIL